MSRFFWGPQTFFWRGQLRNAPDDDLRILPLTSLPGAEMTPAFSTDGRLLAYAWNGPQEDNFDIYVQQVGGGSPLRLTDDPASDTNPAFSRDGQWLAFVRNREDVYIKPVLGGRPERRVGRTNFAGIDFAPDGDAVAVSGPAPPGELPAGIRLVSLKDGTEQSVTNPPAGASDIEPRFSPDGQRLAFLRVTGAAVMDIHVQSVHGGPAVRVTHDNLSIEGLTWAPGGRELVFSSIRAGFGRLYRVEIDSRRVRTLSVNHGSFYPAFDVAGNRLAYNYRDLDLNIWKLEIGREDSAPLEAGISYANPSSRSTVPRSRTIMAGVRPSPRSGAHRRRTRGASRPATPWSRRISDTESRRAIAAGPVTRGTRQAARSAARTPPGSADNPPRARTLRIWGHFSQGDTPIRSNPSMRYKTAEPFVARQDPMCIYAAASPISNRPPPVRSDLSRFAWDKLSNRDRCLHPLKGDRVRGEGGCRSVCYPSREHEQSEAVAAQCKTASKSGQSR